MEADYGLDITEETRKELVDFIRWYNRVIGHDPLIVGGWAAWAYHQGLGSKDIDVVFPSAASKQATLLDYFRSHGFKNRSVDLFDYEFYKERKTPGGRVVEVLVDAVSADRNVIVSGTSITIPWGLAEKHKRRFYFGPNAEAYIVSPELLLVYKVGALVGREYKRKSAVGSRLAHYRTKIWKDARDVSGLFDNCSFNSNLLLSLLASCGLGNPERLGEALAIGERQFEGGQKELFRAKWRSVFGKDSIILKRVAVPTAEEAFDELHKWGVAYAKGLKEKDVVRKIHEGRKKG